MSIVLSLSVIVSSPITEGTGGSRFAIRRMASFNSSRFEP